MKILMVCLGNICRSPIADGLLRKKVKEQGLDVEVDSAGTIALHQGEAPDSRMIETARKNGTDISFLRARQFKVEDFENFDFIFSMDFSNKKNILSLARNEEDRNKVHMLLGELTNQEEASVPDPYYGTQKDFEHVYDLVDQATDILIQKIRQNTIVTSHKI
jgi:protein-tyrosine phosphatase